eukprot:CAMPEP_0185781052 /NCGR_PEP_ID=MMETSP1174-20130828/101095_1 /TAXON_ID=35687 /ORGANISM="Dictyocha speculum, Strain CCMP1381" /LENGTH=60 /DNA_ID=CAMNT_0028470875 /DNA_START=137 /DNA_END=316 /DNA_ORIENTATION=+
MQVFRGCVQFSKFFRDSIWSSTIPTVFCTKVTVSLMPRTAWRVEPPELCPLSDSPESKSV